MKLKAIYFTDAGYSTVRGEHVKHLFATEKRVIELDIATLSVRVDDREPSGEGVYNVPLSCLRRWVPAEEAKPLKKAVGQ